MNRNKINLKMFESYENIINIKLFNEIVSFVIETTNVDCNGFINNLKNRNIWFERTVNNSIQEDYGFKYFGELLERYEQRIGTDIKDIRAIALSLGYSREIITSDMIIGTQLVDFINKIKRLSENDIYLKAALYLYDENRYYNLFEEIALQKFSTTEDIVFALSLFYDTKHGFDLLEKQLQELLGKSKTISVIENYGIYNWLIKTLYPILKNDRRKGIELFKAILAIPTCLIKQDSKTFKVLIENGYTKEEISFLNYICIFYSPIPKTVRTGKSIVEEKIAIEFCINILNSNNKYSNEVYDLICIMLSDYHNFDIKCYGYTGIKDAVINYLDITVPEVFIKLYPQLDRKLFSFDILDDKWNIVQQEFTIEEYRDLFDSLLVLNNFSKEDIEKRIAKYNELTNTDYLSAFNVYRYGRCSIYSKLVEKEVISLSTQFESYLNNNDKDINERINIDIEHLRDYIKRIENRKSFEFYKYLLYTKNFDSCDLEKYNFDLSNLYERRSYYYSSREDIDIKRTFLSKEEHIELLNWLENYIFFIKPDYYMDFVTSMLSNEFISTLISKDDLRKLYFTIIEIDKTVKEKSYLREKYLSKEELELIKKQELEEEERKQQLETEKIKDAVKEKFNSIENASFKEIYEFCYSYRWSKKETSFACNIVKEYLDTSLYNHNFISEEIIYFNKICNLLIQEKFITLEELKEYILKYIQKGELILCKE